jgi:hypothetical protein
LKLEEETLREYETSFVVKRILQKWRRVRPLVQMAERAGDRSRLLSIYEELKPLILSGYWETCLGEDPLEMYVHAWLSTCSLCAEHLGKWYDVILWDSLSSSLLDLKGWDMIETRQGVLV